MNDLVLEWLGYSASLIVLVSLLMSSIKKLRWINLGGALLFGAYGFMIGSIPTGFMNVGIVIIDIYYLVRMYGSKEFFKVLPIEENSEYLESFVDFYKNDISSFMDLEDLDINNASVKLYVLRNMNPAGVFIADEFDKKTLEIKFDYVVPQFRDFKIGNFVFDSQKEYFLAKGFSRFIAFTDNKEHTKYVKRMGFVESKVDGKLCFIKNI